MLPISTISRTCKIAGSRYAQRLLHGSATRHTITQLQMPAMSPTMTEGGIASWKKEEGESFAQGDVLLEIETDKATIDVEAQEDGLMGKILAPNGTKNVPVGKVIALLAEEGDDISNLEAPKDEPPLKEAEEPKSSSSTTQADISAHSPRETSQQHSQNLPEHSRPLFPSVHRLLLEHSVTNLDKINGTGVRGMITKGDVLTYLGKASGPFGTFKFGPSPIEEALALKAGGKTTSATTAAARKLPLDGPAIRRMIVSTMLQSSQKSLNPSPAAFKNADFDSIISDYLPPSALSSPSIPSSKPSKVKKDLNYLDGLW